MCCFELGYLGSHFGRLESKWAGLQDLVKEPAGLIQDFMLGGPAGCGPVTPGPER